MSFHSVRRSGSVSMTGNNVADYSWRSRDCEQCDGEGEILISYEQFMEWLEEQWAGGTKFRFLLKHWHYWKHNKAIKCDKCGGTGNIYEEY